MNRYFYSKNKITKMFQCTSCLKFLCGAYYEQVILTLIPDVIEYCHQPRRYKKYLQEIETPTGGLSPRIRGVSPPIVGLSLPIEGLPVPVGGFSLLISLLPLVTGLLPPSRGVSPAHTCSDACTHSTFSFYLKGVFIVDYIK